jgi:hypothetical protein
MANAIHNDEVEHQLDSLESNRGGFAFGCKFNVGSTDVLFPLSVAG